MPDVKIIGFALIAKQVQRSVKISLQLQAPYVLKSQVSEL